MAGRVAPVAAEAAPAPEATPQGEGDGEASGDLDEVAQSVDIESLQQACGKMANAARKQAESVTKTLLEVRDIAATLQECDMYRSRQKPFEAAIKDLLRVQLDFEAQSQALEDLRSAITREAAEGLDWTEELRTRRNEALQDAIRSQLEGRLKSEISDLQKRSEPENFICPISKSPFLEPVKNPECGHTYSKAAILGLFSRRNPAIKCPVAGCDKRVQAGTLFADREMEHRMSKRRPRAAASSSSSSSAAAAAAGAAGPAADAEAGEIDATQ